MFAIVEKTFPSGYFNIKVYSHKGGCYGDLILKTTTDYLPYFFNYKNRRLVITKNKELKLIKQN